MQHDFIQFLMFVTQIQLNNNTPRSQIPLTCVYYEPHERVFVRFSYNLSVSQLGWNVL